MRLAPRRLAIDKSAPAEIGALKLSALQDSRR